MNTSTSMHHPINLTIRDIESQDPILDHPAYPGYIPARRDRISIRSVAYQVQDRMIEYHNSEPITVILSVIRLIHL